MTVPANPGIRRPIESDNWTPLTAKPAMHKALERTLLCAVAGNTAAIAYQAVLQPLLKKWWRKHVNKGEAKKEKKSEGKDDNTCPCRWCRKGMESEPGHVISAEMLQDQTHSVVEEAIQSKHVPVLFAPDIQDQMESNDNPSDWKTEEEGQCKESMTGQADNLEHAGVVDQMVDDQPVLSTHDQGDKEEAKLEVPAGPLEFWKYCHDASQENIDINKESAQQMPAKEEDLDCPPAVEEEAISTPRTLESADTASGCLLEAGKNDVSLSLSCSLTLGEAISRPNLRYSAEAEAEEEAEDEEDRPVQLKQDDLKARASGDRLWSVYRSDSTFATKLPLTDFRLRRSTDTLFITEKGVQLYDRTMDHEHPMPALKSMQARTGSVSGSSPSPVPPGTPPINWALRLAQSDMMHLYTKNLDLRGSPAQRVPCNLNSELLCIEGDIRGSKKTFGLEDFPQLAMRRSA